MNQIRLVVVKCFGGAVIGAVQSLHKCEKDAVCSPDNLPKACLEARVKDRPTSSSISCASDFVAR